MSQDKLLCHCSYVLHPQNMTMNELCMTINTLCMLNNDYRKGRRLHGIMLVIILCTGKRVATWHTNEVLLQAFVEKCRTMIAKKLSEVDCG